MSESQSAAPVGLAAPAEAPGARVGAARALRIVDSEGKSLVGTLSEPKWETRGGGLFFTLEAGGTRNVWRAFPDPRDASRYPRWRALAVTQYAPPLFAASACPLQGDRALLMLSNAANPRGAAQVTLLDLSRQRLTALTNETGGVFSFSPAPDGQSFAFDSAPSKTAPQRGTSRANVGGFSWAVRRQNMGSGAPLPEPALIERDAWRPVWQGGDSLLVERRSDGPTLRSDGPVLRVPAGDSRPAGRSGTKIAEGTQVSASRDGSTLVLVKKSGATSRLFLLAGDGSGLRALGATEGAQSPALSGDGQLLAYTAPLSGETRAETRRALWIMPIYPASRGAIEAPRLAIAPAPPVPTSVAAAPVGIPVGIASGSPVGTPIPASTFGAPQIIGNAAPARPVTPKSRGAAPVAQIRGVEGVAGNTVRILGVASGEGASATLEIGPGANPTRLESWRIPLPLAPGAPLFLWTPPASARGLWNLRLSVSGSGGAAQSQFSVRLPLAPRPGAAGPATFGSMPAGGPLPSAPLPDLPAAPPRFSAPLPPLLPAPPARDTAPASSNPNPNSNPAPVRVVPAPRPNLPAPAPDTLTPDPSATNSAASAASNASRPVSPSPSPNPLTRQNIAGQTGRDAATFNVSDTLAEMSAGQRVMVTFWGLNRGSRAWDVSAARGGVVRLVTRWVRFEGGNRNGWTYQNMKTATLPGARARWSFDLTAPTQPGRYKLIYALQRVPSNSWAPPAYNAPQETWPDDFAAIAFAVVVKPAS